MSNILASLDDINVHLPDDKIEADDNNIALLQVDVARFIRAMLAGTFTTVTISGWDSPATTPDIIRSIAGRLIAAKFYQIRYAEDSDDSTFATRLYNFSMRQINDIRSGTLMVLDVNEVAIETSGLSLATDDFWPNDTTDAPKFTMGRVIG